MLVKEEHYEGVDTSLMRTPLKSDSSKFLIQSSKKINDNYNDAFSLYSLYD